MKKKLKRRLLIVGIVALALIVVAAIFLLNVNIRALSDISNESYVTFDDIQKINEQNMFGKFVETNLDKSQVEVGGERPKVGKVIFKLFGLIPIKSVDVQILDDENVYLGGNPVGFSIKTNGVIVVGKNSVLTENGLVSNCDNQNINSGDIITHIDGIAIKDANDIPSHLKDVNGSVKLTLKRNAKSFDVTLNPIVDTNGNKKIGLWVRDDATGIGTLTYVDSKTLDFGALGHPVTDGETGTKIDIQNGQVYDCSVVGLEKGQRGKPGELKGVFLSSKNAKGEIEGGNDFGIYGKILEKSGIVDENVVAGVGGRLAVKPGKAQIMSSVSGVREYYDIEIIKASKQKTAKDKSMVFRVTDKRLLELTGGIIQGMSGSPILQNGKLVGAVTHVFVSDPTKGYGIYIDWMMV
ncbi:MAG: SpoIVB peptidase [Christensenellales bacterium]